MELLPVVNRVRNKNSELLSSLPFSEDMAPPKLTVATKSSRTKMR